MEELEVTGAAAQAEEPVESAPRQEEADAAVATDDAELAVNAETAPPFDPALKAIIEAVVYLTDEPLTADQIAQALDKPLEDILKILEVLVEEYDKPDRGLSIREVAGGYKMSTKAEHHEAIRTFVKSLKPPLKLSLAALETLAVIAYKQPITAPEIMEIRGVQGAGVLKTLVDRKLITTAGRKAVIGKPILYKTTKDFLLQFGLKDLAELPSLKEFEELRRLALSDEEPIGMPSPEEKTSEDNAEITEPEAVTETKQEAAAAESPEPASEGNSSEAEPETETEKKQDA